MSSTFAWVDHSEEQRRKVQDAITLFHEQGTVDELGLGTIRDAFANLLFPGTSSIQTRARYFLFIPWIYRDLERRRVPASQFAAALRDSEVRLIDVLAQTEGPNSGTIGIQARERLARFPSNIYWAGLKRLGICTFPGSQEEYHRGSERLRLTAAGALRNRNDDKELVDRPVNAWHARLPDQPARFPAGVSFRLTEQEAAYLRDRIETAQPLSLFAYLARHFSAPPHVRLVWEHGLAASLPSGLRVTVGHARRFSLVMNGAALLYNLMLAKARSDSSEQQARYEAMLGGWCDKVEADSPDIAGWDRAEFWRVVRTADPTSRPLTEDFVNAWLDAVLKGTGPRGVIDSIDMHRLIADREHKLKRGLARLSNNRALELWQGDSGIIPFDYRWSTAQQFLNDFYDGLRGGGDA